MHGAYDPLVVGVCYTRDRLKTALNDLSFAGFSNDRIGVVVRGDRSDWATPEIKTINTSAVANSAGAGIGGVWAMGVAARMVPALGPVVAGGILGSILPSAAVGVSGGLAGALIRLGLGEQEAHFYESDDSAKRVLLTVRASDRYALATSILEKNDGHDVRTAHASGAGTDGKR